MNNKNMLGVMLDCSRNGVMRVDTVKRYAKLLSDMGYNTLMLYTEDTFEVDNQPFFGYMRGRYTKEELKELDNYCASIGIELVPCIQTLAHLNCIFKWYDEYDKVRDCDDILLIDEPETYKLIEDMLSTISECFTSKKIHIGMDEAYRVGLGNYLIKHGYSNRFDIINRHLHKVCEIADKYALEPMIWSDMFCKLALNSENYYEGGNLEDIRKQAALPENISLVYWDYYNRDIDCYNKMFTANKAFERPIVFAGGAWTWKSFAPDNTMSLANTEVALTACEQNGIKDIFFTVWGDDGNECSRFAILPTLFYAKERLNGNTNIEDIKAKFEEFIGIAFDDFLLLDKMHGDTESGFSSPLRMHLYGDPLMGIFDFEIDANSDEYYKELGAKLKSIKVEGDCKHIFSCCASLCDVLNIKSVLSQKTRKFYKENNLDALRNIANSDYPLLIERINKFHKVFEEYWMNENKPFGLEIQSVRLGGLAMRLGSCQQRILDYCDGKFTKIEELEEEVLPSIHNTTWARVVSPGVISHMV